MRRADIIGGIILAVVGLFTIFVIVPDQIGDSSDIGIAPDVYPLTLLWLIVGLAVLLAVSRWIRRASLDDRVSMLSADWKFIAGSGVYLLAAFGAIDLLGFRLGGPLVLAVPVLAMENWRAHRLRSLLICALVPLALYYVFWNVFRVPLP